MTQERIQTYLVEEQHYPISRRQIGYDLEWCRQDCANFVKQNRRHVAEEYRKVVSNLEQLRREAWNMYTNKDTPPNIRASLFDTLQSLNNNLLNVLSIGDMIEIELLKEAEEETKKIGKEIKQQQQHQAIFS